MVYHVSPTSGITVLMPRVSSHGKAYVYAMSELVPALLFGAAHDDFDFLLDTDDRGVPVVYECYPGAFRSVYFGKRCSVYELKEDGFLRGVTSWAPELVCMSKVPVEKETPIDDLYERLLAEEASGRLVIHRYTDTPEYGKLISEHIVDRLIRFDALDRLETDRRFQQYYKRIIEALRGIMDGHLL